MLFTILPIVLVLFLNSIPQSKAIILKKSKNSTVPIKYEKNGFYKDGFHYSLPKVEYLNSSPPNHASKKSLFFDTVDLDRKYQTNNNLEDNRNDGLLGQLDDEDLVAHQHERRDSKKKKCKKKKCKKCRHCHKKKKGRHRGRKRGGKKGRKHTRYGEKSHHHKGHKTRGFHNEYHKDEHHKEHKKYGKGKH